MLWSSAVHVRRGEALGKRGMGMWPNPGLGAHRFPLVGSGDTAAAWSVLAYEVYVTTTSANVGVHWSHDLGGFDPDQDKTGPPAGTGGRLPLKPAAGDEQLGGMCSWPELWLRWVQWGLFSPIFRTHCEAVCRCEPWYYMVDDTYTKAITAAFQLRNRLVPYIYTAAANAYDTGHAISRPMYWETPAEDAAYSEEFKLQYYFGSANIIVAAIATEFTHGDENRSDSITTRKSVWLPQGTWWPYLQNSNTSVTAGMHGTVFTSTYSLLEYPVFVRAGTILPTKALNATHVIATDPLTFVVFPGGGGTTTQVYEDAGQGRGHESGAFYRHNISCTGFSSCAVLPRAAGKGYSEAPKTRAYAFRFLLDVASAAARPYAATCNGKAAAARAVEDGGYDGVEVLCVSMDAGAKLSIELTSAGGL